VGVGAGADPLNSGNFNTFIGSLAGNSNTTGTGNTFIGRRTGTINTESRFNTYTGVLAGDSSIGESNSFYGKEAGKRNLGDANTFVGSHAGLNNHAIQNVFIGYNTGVLDSTGRQNTFVGTAAGQNNKSGSSNTFLGWNTANANRTGKANTIVGYNSNMTSDILDSTVSLGTNARVGGLGSIAIGAGSYAPALRTMILGANNVNIGIGMSGDFPGPRNKLEINSRVAVNPASGLQFTDLTTASFVNPSFFTGPTKGVLSVDDNGKVVLVQDQEGTGGGINSDCIAQNFLPKVASNGSPNLTCSIIYDNNTNVGISTTTPSSKLHISQTEPLSGITLNQNTGLCPSCYANRFRIFLGDAAINTPFDLINDETYFWGYRSDLHFGTEADPDGKYLRDVMTIDHNNRISIANNPFNAEYGKWKLYVEANDNDNGAGQAGIYINCIETSAKTLNYSYGIQSYAIGNKDFATAPNGTNMAGKFIANNANWNYGIDAEVNTALALHNYAVYASAPIGVGNYAGYFAGNVYATGTITSSDIKLKENIADIPNALGKIMQLRPKSFNYKTTAFPSMNLPLGKKYGLVAQDVEPILPEVVSENTQPSKRDSLGNIIDEAVAFKGLEYKEFIPILIKAMQEQQSQIDSLKTQINSCCQNSQSRTIENNTATIDVNLSSRKIVLNQNSPNPFKEQTTISYFIPKDANKVLIIFTDMQGDVLKEVPVSEKGKGSLNVYASDLSSGIYTYSIVADGVTIDSKKMVCSK
jgi:hypothetical protein